MNPAWVIENFLEVKNNQLHISGAAAADLANRFDTPLFVFSEPRIRHNIERLKRAENAIDCGLKICYAAKANSNMAILRAVREAGSDLEVNSGGELFKALKIGFRPEQIIFNGTSKTEREIEEATLAGIYAIQADSIYEIELIERIARRINKPANVSLRLVPEIETETLHGLQTALLTSKFGMMPDEALAAFRRWKLNDEFLNLCGIHLHIGSQNPNAPPYA
jgi:diaminopimelate decarboxylase